MGSAMFVCHSSVKNTTKMANVNQIDSLMTEEHKQEVEDAVFVCHPSVKNVTSSEFKQVETSEFQQVNKMAKTIQNATEATKTFLTELAESTESSRTDNDLVVDQKDSREMEELFDKLVESEAANLKVEEQKNFSLTKDSSVDSFFRTGSASGEYNNDGDESSIPDSLHDNVSTTNNCDSDVTLMAAGNSIRDNTSETITDGEDSTISEKATKERRRSLSNPNSLSGAAERAKAKRRRNRTIDNHDLWCVTVAQYTQKTYTKDQKDKGTGYSKEETACQTQLLSDGELENSNGEDGLGQGLGIIIDKLKNIENKLDELKTIDHEPDLSNMVLPSIGITPTPAQPALTPTMTMSTSSEDQDQSMVHYCIQRPDSEAASKPEQVESDEDEDKTLIVDDEEEDANCDNVVVKSPSPEVSMPQDEEVVQRHPDIVSITSDMSDFDLDEELNEEEEAASRAKRIEELAKKMLGDASSETSKRSRHPSDPGVRSINEILGDLDTVSERSELEEDEHAANAAAEDDGNESDSSSSSCSSSGTRSFERYCRKKVMESNPAARRGQSLRTRSASRERTLAKIKYCWRCHQTGHESYDCTVELHPAAWCPRCLESSHWEDGCWVTSKEVRLSRMQTCWIEF